MQCCHLVLLYAHAWIQVKFVTFWIGENDRSERVTLANYHIDPISGGTKVGQAKLWAALINNNIMGAHNYKLLL